MHDSFIKLSLIIPVDCIMFPVMNPVDTIPNICLYAPSFFFL